jgi:hypothetical protein
MGCWFLCVVFAATLLVHVQAQNVSTQIVNGRGTLLVKFSASASSVHSKVVLHVLPVAGHVAMKGSKHLF